MEKKPQSSHLILSLIVVLISFIGCDNPFDENPFDEGPEEEPDFTAAAAFRNPETQVTIEIMAERASREVSGEGILILEDDTDNPFELEVIGGSLPTDFGMEDPIPQLDNTTGDFVFCTPSFAEFMVRVSRGDFEDTTVLRLNECEEDNAELFEEDGVITNPCTEEEVTGMEEIEKFKGVCLSDPENGVDLGKDTIVLEEFDGFCGPEAPCVVPRDVVIIVPAFR